MKFKRPEIEIELLKCPTLLRLMAFEFDKASMKFGIEPVITRILGKIDGDSGVHSAHRAIDFRDEYTSDSEEGQFIYTLEQRQFIINHIESLFLRQDGVKSIIHHSFQNGPYHFHIQIGPNPSAYAPMLRPKE